MRSISIIIAGALIATAIVLTNRWELIPMPAVSNGVSMALLLDRWTGVVRVCLAVPDVRDLACAK
jgi:hypothetical protein